MNATIKTSDWFEALRAAGHKSVSRQEILERITSHLVLSVPDDYFSLEVRLDGYAQVPGSSAWAPEYKIYLARRIHSNIGRSFAEHLIFDGPPETAKLILAAFAEAMRGEGVRVVVVYWREGFILLRHWGSADDKGCETHGHAIFPGVVSARRPFHVGEVRSLQRCLCGARQDPDIWHPQPIPPCLFLDEFIASTA